MRCSVYIVCPSVLSCSNLKLHQTSEVKNIFKQENIMVQLTFNPGLTLPGFRTTRPRRISENTSTADQTKTSHWLVASSRCLQICRKLKCKCVYFWNFDFFDSRAVAYHRIREWMERDNENCITRSMKRSLILQRTELSGVFFWTNLKFSFSPDEEQ